MSETVKNKHVKKKNPDEDGVYQMYCEKEKFGGFIIKDSDYSGSSFLYLVFMQSLYGISEKCNKSGK